MKKVIYIIIYRDEQKKFKHSNQQYMDLDLDALVNTETN